MRIAVLGMTGRMGRLVAEAVPRHGAELVGGIAGPSGAHAGNQATVTAAGLAEAADVVIDFTHADAVPAHAEAVLRGGSAWVLGTTGLAPADQEAVRAASSRVAVVQAANFSPGVTLVLALAEMLGRLLPADAYDAEIIEMHHRSKVDAPSGTALALGRAVALGRQADFDTLVLPPRDGQTGIRPAGGIGVASLRGGQVVGEHTLLFAGDGEHITLSHKALDRRVFADGAVRAALWAGPGRKPGLYSMRDVLGMPGLPTGTPI